MTDSVAITLIAPNSQYWWRHSIAVVIRKWDGSRVCGSRLCMDDDNAIRLYWPLCGGGVQKVITPAGANKSRDKSYGQMEP